MEVKKDDGVRRLLARLFVGVVVDVVVSVVDVDIRRNVLGFGISCLRRTSSSILCARRSVNVTSKIQTTRRNIATTVIIRDKNFFLLSLIVEFIFKR